MGQRHCLHLTGRTSRAGNVGVAEKICCDCEKTFNIKFEEVMVRVMGHGPYHKVSKIEYYNDPEEECPHWKEK